MRNQFHHVESPSPVNPLGVKGAAESGTIGAHAGIVSAIEDALAPLGVTIRDLPVTPARLREPIAAAEGPAVSVFSVDQNTAYPAVAAPSWSASDSRRR